MNLQETMDAIHTGLELAYFNHIPVHIKEFRQSDVVSDSDIVLYKSESPAQWLRTIHAALMHHKVFLYSAEADRLEAWNERFKFNYSD